MKKKLLVCAMPLICLGIAACERRAAAPPPSPSPFIVTASIQDIMSSIVDPSADYLWEKVGTIVDKTGTHEYRPHTDEEWAQARQRAITLIEATNLLVMEGRRVVEEGKKLENEGEPGILTAAQVQKLVDADRPSFVAYAHGLHATATVLLKAIDAKDAKALLEGGEPLDAVCEACHVKYWYPNQGN